MAGFNQFLAFGCAARHRSFAAAGRELGLTPSTVAKRILRLEEQLGVKLFHRTTRQVTLTSDGEGLYERCEKILAELDELEALAAGSSGEPRGELRITVPVTFGKQIVLPVVARLLEQYSALSADVRLSDSFCDLVREGMDAAVRVSAMPDSRLVSRRIGWQFLIACASPDYLRASGEPQHPERLEGHRFIVFRNPTSGRDRPVQFEMNRETLDLHPSRRLVVDDGEGMVQAAISHAGLAQVPHYMATEALRNGQLVEVLKAFRPPPLPIHVVWPGNRMMPVRLRVLIDALAALEAPART